MQNSVRVAGAMVRFPTVHTTPVTVGAIREVLENAHVHIALIVDREGLLLTTIMRGDIPLEVTDDENAAAFGHFAGRVVSAAISLEEATVMLKTSGSRRLAVVDHKRKLLGLLCLKRNMSGYCTDDGIAERRRARIYRRHGT